MHVPTQRGSCKAEAGLCVCPLKSAVKETCSNLKCEMEELKIGIQVDFEVLLTAGLQVSGALWGCTGVFY